LDCFSPYRHGHEQDQRRFSRFSQASLRLIDHLRAQKMKKTLINHTPATMVRNKR
jgi:hypothetical protein